MDCTDEHGSDLCSSMKSVAKKVKEPIQMFKTLRTSRQSTVLCLAFAFTLAATPLHAQTAATAKPPDPLKALQYRSIGPYRGGRSAAVAGVRSQPMVFYY